MPREVRGSDLFAANGVVVRLRDARHEAAVANTRRKLASYRLREETWAGVWVALGAIFAILGLALGAFAVLGGGR